MIVTDKFVFFWGGEYSQWFKSFFKEGRITFSTAEQYMMYHKAKLMKDEKMAQQILNIHNPKLIKALGRQIENFDSVLWDAEKLRIVTNGNVLKFNQNPRLKELITVTHKGKRFVEASPHDKVWGIGLGLDNPDIHDESKWQGENLLGKCLDATQLNLLNPVNLTI